jgi:hypothetical protein
LPLEVVPLLRAYHEDRPQGARVGGTRSPDGAAMLRLDLEAAGISERVEGPDGPLFVDFHSLGHSYIALLDKTGATLKEAMHSARPPLLAATGTDRRDP